MLVGTDAALPIRQHNAGSMSMFVSMFISPSEVAPGARWACMSPASAACAAVWDVSHNGARVDSGFCSLIAGDYTWISGARESLTLQFNMLCSNSWKVRGGGNRGLVVHPRAREGGVAIVWRVLSLMAFNAVASAVASTLHQRCINVVTHQ
jgi:hypothetical protein